MPAAQITALAQQGHPRSSMIVTATSNIYHLIESVARCEGRQHYCDHYLLHCLLQETENAYHSSALLVKLLLLQAQGAGSSLGVDTSQLENELMLRDIKATEAVALSRPAADFQQRAGLGALGTAPLQPVNLAASSAAQERDRLKEEVSRGALVMFADDGDVDVASIGYGQEQQIRQIHLPHHTNSRMHWAAAVSRWLGFLYPLPHMSCRAVESAVGHILSILLHPRA